MYFEIEAIGFAYGMDVVSERGVQSDSSFLARATGNMGLPSPERQKTMDRQSKERVRTMCRACQFIVVVCHCSLCFITSDPSLLKE